MTEIRALVSVLCRAVAARPPIEGLTCHGVREVGADAEAIEMATLGWIGALSLTSDLRALARLAPTRPAPPNNDSALRKLKADFLAERISAAEYERRRDACCRGASAELAGRRSERTAGVTW